MRSKTCFKCLEVKLLSEFYKHPKMADGHVNKCKTCNKLDVRRHRRENDSVREYDRLRYHRDDKMKKIISRTSKEWIANNPERRRAQNALNNAIRDGKITRQPCRICGDARSHGHHHDYSKPFDVDWLCAKHHQREHNPIE